MADLESQFEEFHKRIRLSKENETLREKRDIILEKISNYLRDHDLPGFRRLLQGSYAMGVGTISVEGQDYDIDVGLIFPFSADETSPSEPRGWVWEAIKDHTNEVDRKGPCIRVTYADGYHVDLVIYANWIDPIFGEQYRLAHRTKGWREADPAGLNDYVKRLRDPFEGSEDDATKTDQFRRVVRYLKRWNDLRIPGESDDKPTGLALVLLVGRHLRHPVVAALSGRSDDCAALRQVAEAASQAPSRIEERKPTPEHEDMFGRISDEAMEELKADLGELAQRLREAQEATDPREAALLVASVLGDEFPVPEVEETANATAAPAIVTSQSSA